MLILPQSMLSVSYSLLVKHSNSLKSSAFYASQYVTI